ncbi:MAG: metal ABC transporter substrate-binding protein [Verrucomicrobiota bacterium]
MRKILLLVLFAISLSSSLLADKIKIVTTFLPIYAHTKSIVGDLAEVHSLVESGGEPHDFQFKPSDMKKLSEAQVIVMNGVGIETWLEKPLSKFKDGQKVIIDTSAGIDLLDNPEVIELTAAHQSFRHEENGAKNPHIWLDPLNAKIQVKNILKGLIQADPPNKMAYERNAERYLLQLDQLNQDFKTEVETLKNKNLITFHDAFPYLAKRYGFHYLGCIEDFPEKSPSPRVLKEMVDLIQKNQVTTVFVEEGYSQRSLQSIARESGAKIATLDTLEVGASEADAYLKRMRNNLEILKTSWK